MDAFIHPWYMIAGAILVSAPIIIHLINRMRFRRIRWAAMEFLLKSQKRNRRRLIIEQLILLALRCLLVALAGFLVARFISSVGVGENSTEHLVVIDDTVSMGDRWKEEGEEKRAFDVAKQRIKQLVKDASTASSPQYVRVVLLSDLDNVIYTGRLNDQSLSDIGKKIDDLARPSALHVKPIEAVRWAQKQFAEIKDHPVHFLHLVSDLRDGDWTGPEADKLNAEIETLTGAGARVLLHDIAHPYRSEKQAVALNHENVGIVDFRPETRYAAEGVMVQFALTVRNFGDAERKGVYLDVRVNGEVRFINPQLIDIPVGESTHKFELSFNKPGFNQVVVQLTGEEAGVAADDSRVAVIEVRKQVPVLLIDGSEATPEFPRDSYYLSTVFNVARGYESVVKAPRDLDDLDLPQYPCIYLLNVAQFSPKAVEKLEDYVNRGGRIAFFVGDKVRALHYNEMLYKNGQGLFPVPLEARPTEPLETEKKLERLLELQYQVYFRDPSHPVFAQVAQPKYREHFKFLMIDRHWPALPRFQWNVDPNRVKELVTLPNRNSPENYSSRAVELAKTLPLEDEKLAKFKGRLEFHQRRIRDAVTEKYLYPLANALEALLNDFGDPKDVVNRPNLVDGFWALPENQSLRRSFQTLLETVQYGDPLVLSNRFGRGQTVTFLTTAGKSWNDWAGGCPASWTYPTIMLDLQRYLTGVGDEGNQLVGGELKVELAAAKYQPKARCFLLGMPGEAKADAAKPAQDGPQDLGDIEGQVSGGQLTFRFNGGREDGSPAPFKAVEPGIYYLQLQPKPEAGAAEPPKEERAYVFNVDTASEGNLRRAAREALERASGGKDAGRVTLVTPDMDLRSIVAPKRKDMSESPWLYLVILVILIIEQALAVHLSFHLKGTEQQQAPGQTTMTPVPAEAA